MWIKLVSVFEFLISLEPLSFMLIPFESNISVVDCRLYMDKSRALVIVKCQYSISISILKVWNNSVSVALELELEIGSRERV